MKDILDACKDLPVTEVASGDALIREGAETRRFFILISGTISVTKGEVEVARITEPGAVFGEISALLDIPASATVTAVDDARLYIAEDASGFIRAHPEIAVHTARILARRLYDATAYLADLKAQFQDQSNHFGMMDTILAALLEQQKPAAPDAAPTRPEDPRV
jgi:CRP-like cAMP-binding protein